MKMIVGLGNPGSKYEGTRHNTGFETLDILADRYGIRVNTNRQKGLIGSGRIGEEKVLLVKPLTYMNLSGECVRPVADYYKIPPEDIVVICDDVYLEIGQIRVRGQGSAGGHNGLKNIIACLGSSDFRRVRVGVGKKPEQMDLADFVLGHIPKEWAEEAQAARERAADAAESLITDGLEKTMNRFNGFVREEKKNG